MNGLMKTCLLCLVALIVGGDALAQPLNEERRLQAAIARLQPQRPGVVDAYVVAAALDADPVFNREAREAGRVLARRFDAQGRTLVLAHDEGGDEGDAAATPTGRGQALDGVAAKMNANEDVLVLYTTSHGSPDAGLNFRDPVLGAATITPSQLAAILNHTGVKNRLVILQACFSGQFVRALKN